LGQDEPKVTPTKKKLRRLPKTNQSRYNGRTAAKNALGIGKPGKPEGRRPRVWRSRERM